MAPNTAFALAVGLILASCLLIALGVLLWDRAWKSGFDFGFSLGMRTRDGDGQGIRRAMRTLRPPGGGDDPGAEGDDAPEDACRGPPPGEGRPVARTSRAWAPWPEGRSGAEPGREALPKAGGVP